MRRTVTTLIASVTALLALSATAQAGWLDGLQDDGPTYDDQGDRGYDVPDDGEDYVDVAARPSSACAPLPTAGHAERGARSAQILWHGTWYEGTVLERRGEQYFIHYSGYDNSWNEWVGPDRLRFVTPAHRPVGHRGMSNGAQILWGGQWWNGTVLQQRGNQYYIHYDGYDDSWNEWVGPDRIRLPEAAPRRASWRGARRSR